MDTGGQTAKMQVFENRMDAKPDAGTDPEKSSATELAGDAGKSRVCDEDTVKLTATTNRERKVVNFEDRSLR